MSRRRLLCLCGLLVTAVICGGQQTRAVPAKERILVLLSIDGMPGWAFDDPRLPIPTMRRLAREGALARGMKVSNPSVTWPNHTTLVTGVPPAVHGVLFNGMLLRQGPRLPVRIEPWRDKAEMVRAATVYDLAHRAGLTTAQVDWVAIQNPGTITWEFPERPKATGAIEKELVGAGVLTEKDIEEFNSKSNPPWRDQMWTSAAAHIIRKHKPNLLLFHLLNLDSTHHRYGPRTLASQNGIALADARVAQVLEAIEAAGLRDRATVLIVSDHGFKTAPKTIRPNAELRRLGLVKGESGKIECDAWVVSEGGTAMVYVTNPENRARLVPQLKELFAKMEGVGRVIEPAEYAALGLPHPSSNDQMADLFLAAKEGYGFSAIADGPVVVEAGRDSSVGFHGYLSADPDLDAMFLAWGHGIRPGVQLGTVDNLDVAPTIAVLLGVKLDGAKGKPLSEILK